MLPSHSTSLTPSARARSTGSKEASQRPWQSRVGVGVSETGVGTVAMGLQHARYGLMGTHLLQGHDEACGCCHQHYPACRHNLDCVAALRQWSYMLYASLAPGIMAPSHGWLHYLTVCYLLTDTGSCSLGGRGMWLRAKGAWVWSCLCVIGLGSMCIFDSVEPVSHQMPGYVAGCSDRRLHGQMRLTTCRD